MQHRYSDEFSSPPALILPVEVHAPRRVDAGMSCRGKVDTAADLSVLPRQCIKHLKLVAFNTLSIRQTGRQEWSYLVEIVVEGRRYSVEAITHDRPYILLGRDILNDVKLIADGPSEVFEIVRRR
ncbi:MAG TPA: hypothetical protein VHM90_14575 [Phycisphaerae bacterium]|nr:hypothetical protein [Phycisphaerae bacterium]